MSRSAMDHVRFLKRRRDHLHDQYASQLREHLAGGREPNTFLRAELGALEWALPTLEMTAIIEGELHRALAEL